MSKVRKITEVINDSTESYDEIVSLHNLKLNETNKEMYDGYEEEHLENTMNTIISVGLRKPISVYNDKTTIRYGHNRYLALKKLGFEEAPVTYSNESIPKDKLQEMISLAIDNMGRPHNLGRSFKSVEIMREAWKQTKGNSGKEPEINEIRQWCSYHNISYKSYKDMKSLEGKYQYLLDKVISGNMAITAAIREMNDMKNGSSVSLNRTPFMNELIGQPEAEYAIASVTAVVNSILGISLNKPNGESWKPFDEFQQNIIGGMVHEIFTNSIKEIVNHHHNKEVLTAPKNQKVYDLEALLKQSGIETKTCVTPTGKNPKWVTHRYKDGYVILLSLNPNGTRAFCGYGIIEKDCWRPGKPVGQLKINELYKQKSFNVIFGDIEEENGKIKIQHNPILM